MFEYRFENVFFQCHETIDSQRQLLFDDSVLDFLNGNYFSFHPDGNNPFDPDRDQISFNSDIENICFKIFDTVKKMYEDRVEERYSSLLVARLFETFAGFWSRVLLSRNLDRIGIVFWRKVLSLVKDWQKNNPGIFIHTGTPYYFLAENYLMIGDLDSAFTYLHNANLIDQKSWQWEYPDHMGSYCLAKLLDKQNSQMNYIVTDVRSELQKYIINFNQNYGTFSLKEFDDKFLRNEHDLLNLGYFFTYTFFSIIQNQRNAELESEENNFSQLRSLDLIFNLCLIIDEILKKSFLKDETNPEKTTMSYSIEKLCLKNQWVNSYDLRNFWETQNKFSKHVTEPIITMLLEKTEIYNDKPIEKEVFTMLLVYVLRNYGAHNLNQESIIVKDYPKIINELMMALFISVKSIE